MTAAEIMAALAAPFDADQVRQRTGRGGISLSWVDARTVSERLNTVLGVGGWDWHIERQSDGVVLGTLTVRVDGQTVVRQDYGYMTGGSGEDLKEAASDCLRRCASLYGVAAYLYQHGAAHEAPVPAPRVAVVAPTRHAEATPVDTVYLQTAQRLFGEVEAQTAKGGVCPDHGQAWTLKPAGISKATGKPYKPFYSCTSKSDGQWCRNRPDSTPIGREWLAAHPADGSPAPVAQEPDLSELPF